MLAGWSEENIKRTTQTFSRSIFSLTCCDVLRTGGRCILGNIRDQHEIYVINMTYT